jgi:hypothetical protein
MKNPALHRHIHSSSCRSGKATPQVGSSITGKVLRFSGWFFGFAGLFAMGSVCPFCGQQGCPVGSAGAGIVGLLFAALMQWGKTILKAVSAIVNR